MKQEKSNNSNYIIYFLKTKKKQDNSGLKVHWLDAEIITEQQVV